MPKAFQPLAYWRGQTNLLREGLLQRINELSVSDYPTVSPNQTIRFLQDFLHELSSVIQAASSEDELRVLRMQIAQLGIFLEWLDNAHTEQTPRGLVQILKHLIEQMVPNTRVVARPQAKYNYSITDLGDFLKKLVEIYIPHSKQIKFKEYLSSPTKLISFPRIERDNMLAHAIFGHELGHPIADNYLDTETIDASEIQKKLTEWFEKQISMQGLVIPDNKKLEQITQLFNQVLIIRKRALQELISDAVGIIIFGPSAFFACYEILWGGDIDALPAHDEYYPPSRMRIRLMLALMREQKITELMVKNAAPEASEYIGAMNLFMTHCENIAASNQDIEKIENSPLHKIAYDSLMQNYKVAIKYAENHTKNVAFNAEVVGKQISELLNRIELHLPPNEIGNPKDPQPVDYRASLLASWLFKLRNINSETKEELSSSDIERLHKLTLRAIEYVILKEDYITHMKATSV